MTLTLDNMREAYRQGLLRYDEARRHGRRRMFYADEERQRSYNGEANVAEALVRDYLGLPPATPLLEPDAGVGDAVGGWEIRWTRLDSGLLRVRPGDPSHFKYVLVTGYAPNQVIRGWIAGYEAKVERYLWPDPPPPTYRVPQSELLAL